MENDRAAGHPEAQRRVAIAVVANLVLLIAGRVAMLMRDDWLAIPFLLGMVVIVAVMTGLEARAQHKKVPELLSGAFRRMVKRPR